MRHMPGARTFESSIVRQSAHAPMYCLVVSPEVIKGRVDCHCLQVLLHHRPIRYTAEGKEVGIGIKIGTTYLKEPPVTSKQPLFLL